MLTCELLLDRIKRKKIKTWFDLGIFLDSLAQRRSKLSKIPKDFQEFSSFSKFLGNGSFAFFTYDLGVDGVSTEISNYIRAFRKVFPDNFKACLIVGDFNDEADVLKRERGKIPLYRITQAAGFEKWGDPYQFLFFHKLKRGDKIYNLLPSLIWKQSLIIIEKIFNIIQKENIRCFVISNISSNPGNLSLTLATVILSEVLGIPVVNINHDFYWEDGKNPSDRAKGEMPGVRDHFFTNADLGEFFSIIKLLYPWRSRSWTQVNISKHQSKVLIDKEGLNPDNVTEIGTAVDVQKFRSLNFLEKEKVYYKLNLLFSSLYKKPVVFKPTNSQINIRAMEGKPFIIAQTDTVRFSPASTLLFLQPTRIIERKQIENNFLVLKDLFENKDFKQYLSKEKKKVLLLITGPIAPGHFDYFQKIKRKIAEFYAHLTPDFQEKFFVGFKFGKDSNENFLTEGFGGLSIAQLYGLADLVFLLSRTEGRGLPIIESAACGVPLVVNRFSPSETYKEVTKGLKVFVWQENQKFPVEELTPFIIDEGKRKHLYELNIKTVDIRFSYDALKKQFIYILNKLWLQITTCYQIRKLAYQSLNKVLSFRKNSIKEIVLAEKRTYFPGYIPCGFLFYLKSLIDPSFFRVEQLDLKARVFAFASDLVDQVKLDRQKRSLFFKAIESMFFLTWGSENIIVDTSFNYRNRTKRKYLFHQLTEQELKGAVVLLSQRIFGANFDPFLASGIKEKNFSNQFEILREKYNSSWSWETRIKFLFEQANSFNLQLFIKKVVGRPGDVVFFLDKTDDVILDLKILVENLLESRKAKQNKITIYLVVRDKPFFNSVTVDDLKVIFENPKFSLLKKYQQKGIIKILSLPALSQGVNFYQLPYQLKKTLVMCKNNRGIVLARGEDNFVTLDLLDIDSFCFGKVESAQFSRFTGLALNKSFFQYVPAGFRPVLNFPVFTQQLTAFNKQLERINTEDNQILEKLKLRQDRTGENLGESIDNLLQKNEFSKKDYSFGKFAGKHQDGLPFTGAYLKINYISFADSSNFEVIQSVSKGDESLTQMIDRIHDQKRKKVIIGFNGGFILNNELVGRLGLTEDYIGTPLGLVIHNGKILSLPLYNHPVIAFGKEGKIIIQRLSLPAGKIWVEGQIVQSAISWNETQINPSLDHLSLENVAVYNLLYDQKVSIKDRVLLTICGNKIAAVNKPRYKKSINPERELLPVGITLSFPKQIYDKLYFKSYSVGKKVNFSLELGEKWNGIKEALDAGPLLLENGNIVLDMEKEGWTTKHSIISQASRMDQLNNRGPKIAVGIDKKGELIAVAVNSRTRDSFGVTYTELAKILSNMGAVRAMTFDPGGSSSLYAGGKIINIPPYNYDYNRKIYYAPPQARGIGNAIVLIKKTD